METIKVQSQSEGNYIEIEKLPDIPHYNGEDPDYPIDLFLKKIAESGKKFNWSDSKYSFVVLTHLEGRAKEEFLENRYLLSFSWKQLKIALLKRFMPRDCQRSLDMLLKLFTPIYEHINVGIHFFKNVFKNITCNFEDEIVSDSRDSPRKPEGESPVLKKRPNFEIYTDPETDKVVGICPANGEPGSAQSSDKENQPPLKIKKTVHWGKVSVKLISPRKPKESSQTIKNREMNRIIRKYSPIRNLKDKYEQQQLPVTRDIRVIKRKIIARTWMRHPPLSLKEG